MGSTMLLMPELFIYKLFRDVYSRTEPHPSLQHETIEKKDHSGTASMTLGRRSRAGAGGVWCGGECGGKECGGSIEACMPAGCFSARLPTLSSPADTTRS